MGVTRCKAFEVPTDSEVSGDGWATIIAKDTGLVIYLQLDRGTDEVQVAIISPAGRLDQCALGVAIRLRARVIAYAVLTPEVRQRRMPPT